MGLSISIEVNVPSDVDVARLVRIGEESYPYDVDEPMDVGEAIQWAFSTPQGVKDLASLGVQWNAQFQDSYQHNTGAKAA